MIKMGSILHPTDFSDSSKHALDYAVSFAREFSSKLYMLHVIEEVPSTMYFDMLQTPPLAEVLADIEEQAAKALEGLLTDDMRQGLEVECLIREGVPFLEIIRCAKELNVDMIVCGTHGRTGLKHVLFG